MAERLTVERLFSDPPLTTPQPGKVCFSPDGNSVTYTLLSAENREQQDLWLVDCTTGARTCLIKAADLTGGDLSDADRERLERQRQFLGGVTDYAWYPDGRALLLPVGGRALCFDIETRKTRELAADVAGKGEIRLSNTGSYLTFVVDGDLYLNELQSERTFRLTEDGSDTIANGVADFIAQEEMHRFEGYWWSADDQQLVFTKVDSSPIPLTQRQEINADGVIGVEQRYPFAGGPNASVSLWRYDIVTGTTSSIPLPEGYEYLARVTFVGNRLTVQMQDRAQQLLTLYEREGEHWQILHQETSQTWINLHDNLRAAGSDQWLWTTEREGTARLCVNGQPITPVDMHVGSIVAANDRVAWVLGWQDTPVEQHLYSVQLADGGLTRLTEAPGWHTCAVHAQSGRFVSACSNVETPPRLLLCDPAGGRHEMELHATDLSGDHPYSRYLTTHQTPVFGSVEAEDGSTLHYRLTPPLGAGVDSPAPVIVYVYGGPGAQKARNEWTPLLLQLFAHAGFGVFELDNRGSANRGRDFEAALYKSMGTPEVDDQLRGVKALAQYDWVDLNRIGVFGHSYGGYMTLMCLCKGGDVFKAGASAAPVSDWRLYDTHYTERYMGHPETDREAYDRSAVMPWLGQLKSPLLLMHGMADDNVLFTHSTLLMRELQRLNKKFELMTYPGSKHALQERDVSIHRFELILDFFRRNL